MLNKKNQHHNEQELLLQQKESLTPLEEEVACSFS
jgi:hypothetical protein